jgi:predicted ATPase
MDIFPHLIHGTLREHYVLLFGAAGTVAIVAGFVGSWVGARFATRSAIRAADAKNREAIDAGQIRDLANSLETIGLEVERIAEAQRFVAKVLVERRDMLPTPPARREANEITPH